MQVAPSAMLSPQLQALGTAALNQYQSVGDFSFTVGDTDDGSDVDASSSAGSTGAANALSGSFTSGSLIAVGTMTAGGQLDPFSPAQVQSEENMVSNMNQISFADSLQNFLALAQAGSSNGQVGASSYTDQQQFTGDNGLVSAYFNTSFSLDPTGGGQQNPSSALTQSITV